MRVRCCKWFVCKTLGWALPDTFHCQVHDKEASCDIAGCRNGHTAEAVCLEVKDDRDES